MSNTISILLSAKDEASSTIGKLTSNIASGIGNMAKSVQEGLTRTIVALGAVGVGLTSYAKDSTSFTQELVSNTKALQRQTGESIETSSKLLYVIQRMGGSADTAGSQFNILTKQIQATRDQSADTALAQETLRNKIEAAKLQVTALTAEQAKNGDSSGALRNKIDGLNITIRTYQKSLSDATSPLDKLGVSTQNADKSNRSFNDILLDVADKFKAMPDGVEKTNAALGLFGKSGDDMIKTLNLGSAGILDMEKKAESLGLTLTDKTVVAISNYIASQKDLKDSTDGLQVQVGSLTAPVLTNFNNILTQTATEALKANSPLQVLIANVAAFGGPVVTAAAALIGFLANVLKINSGMGLFLTTVLGLSTALLAGGGLLFAFGSLLGLDFSPLAQALHTLFTASVEWINQTVVALQQLASSPEWGGVAKAADGALTYATNLVKNFATALSDGTVTRTLTGIASSFFEVATAVGDYLGPKLSGLWMSFQTNIIPILLDLWHNVIEPLIPVIGTVLVGAIGAVTDVLRIIFDTLGTVYQQLQAGNPIILGLAGVFGTLAAAMAFNAIFDALNVGFATLTLVTIPGAMASVSALGALIAAPIVMPAIAVGAALAAIASVWNAYNEMQSAISGAKAALEQSKQTDRQQIAKFQAILDNKQSLPSAKIAAANQIKALQAGLNAYATGTAFAPGGIAVVGEHGPEIINLPRGSQVQTATQTSRILSENSSSSQNNVFNIVVNNGSGDYHRMLTDIGFALEQAS